jgi:hypothetical protein
MVTNNKDNNENKNRGLSFISNDIKNFPLFSAKLNVNIDTTIKLEALESIAKENIRNDDFRSEDGVYDKSTTNRIIRAKFRLDSFMDMLNNTNKDIHLYNLVRLEDNEEKENFDVSNIDRIEDKIMANEKLEVEDKKLLKSYIEMSNVASRGLKKIGKSNYLILENLDPDPSLDFIEVNENGKVACVLCSDYYGGLIKPARKVRLAFYNEENDTNLESSKKDTTPFVNIYTYYSNKFKSKVDLNDNEYRKNLKDGFYYTISSYMSKKETNLEVFGFKILDNPTNPKLYKALMSALNNNKMIQKIPNQRE